MPGDRFALLIAAGRYDQPGLQQLRSPLCDVDGLGEVLLDPQIGGFEVDRVVDGRHHEVNRAIEVFFRGRSLNTVLLLHISCHGIKNDSGELFFAASDTDRELLASTAVSSSFLHAQMRGCRARSIVLLLDCCYSGAFLPGAKGDETVHLGDELAGRGRAILTATSRTEYAWEGDVLNELAPAPSRFTGMVIQGLLSGEADLDRDGLVTVNDLYDYVYKHMQGAGVKQRRQMWAELEHRVVIARSVPGGRAAQSHNASGPDPPAAVSSADEPAPPSTMEPQYLGERYRLDHMLGRGSSTEVHRAHDTMLGRTVAVKTLRFPLANDASLVARFRREARSAALLNHPAIVAVYDVGTGSLKGVSGPYIVMEYIDGSTLRDLLRFEARPVPERSLEIVVEVLRALEYAHRKGVVHRDVQPASVMLTRNDRVKVMDFGIARATGSVGGTTRQTAVMIGTVRYPSPEQAKGEQIDTRSDIYATGCLLYELLTNRPPFIGDSPVTVAYRHMSEEPQPPSAFGPGISPALDAMVLKALAKEPNNRCQSAAEMRLDVEDHLGGRVGTATGRPVVGPASSSGDSEFEAGPGLADRITLSTQVAGHSAVVRVGGELDYASVGSVAELLHRLRRQGYLHYVVLFEETAALDSAGLNVFLSHRVAVMALSGSMRVVIESSSIHRVFEVLDLDAVLTVHDSLDEAINAMRAAENRSEP